MHTRVGTVECLNSRFICMNTKDLRDWDHWTSSSVLAVLRSDRTGILCLECQCRPIGIRRVTVIWSSGAGYPLTYEDIILTLCAIFIRAE